MRRLATLPALLLAAAIGTQAQTTITGTLLGHDGKPIPMAHIHLADPATHEALATVEAGKDGRFALKTDRTGVMLLQGTGVDHQLYEAPLFIEKPTVIDLSLKLAANHYEVGSEGVQIIGDFNEFDFASAQQMDRTEEGKYVAEFETNAPIFMYQVLGIAGGRSVNGTQSEAFVYDGGGDYRSIVRPANGTVRILLDPTKLIHSHAAAELRFTDPKSTVARVTEVLMAKSKREEEYREAAMKFKASGRDMKEFTYDWSEELESMKTQIAAEKDATVRQALLFSYLDINSKKREADIAKQAVKEIPMTSPLWSLRPTHIRTMLEVAGSSDQSYLEEAMNNHPDMNVRALLHYIELNEAYYTRRQADVDRLYKAMASDYADTEYGRMAMREFNPDRAIMTGKPVPDFTFASLDDPKTSYTRDGLKGKVYLIDFWATWCGPCIAEMENLHTAYEKYHGRGLEYLSLSFDGKPEDVTNFRSKKWKMPWMHSFIDGNFKSDAAERFEVTGIPKPVLVGADGTILATGVDLRGENLDATLAKVFSGETMGAK